MSVRNHDPPKGFLNFDMSPDTAALLVACDDAWFLRSAKPDENLEVRPLRPPASLVADEILEVRLLRPPDVAAPNAEVNRPAPGISAAIFGPLDCWLPMWLAPWPSTVIPMPCCSMPIPTPCWSIPIPMPCCMFGFIPMPMPPWFMPIGPPIPFRSKCVSARIHGIRFMWFKESCFRIEEVFSQCLLFSEIGHNITISNY